jgi:hypothetical protein
MDISSPKIENNENDDLGLNMVNTCKENISCKSPSQLDIIQKKIIEILLP